MFESCKALSLNSHELVIKVQTTEKNPAKALKNLQQFFDQKQIAFPQMLQCSKEDSHTEILLTGPQEIIFAVKRELKDHKEFQVAAQDYSTVTLTCTGATSPDLVHQVLEIMNARALSNDKILMSAMSLTILTQSSERKSLIEGLHSLIQG